MNEKINPTTVKSSLDYGSGLKNVNPTTVKSSPDYGSTSQKCKLDYGTEKSVQVSSEKVFQTTVLPGPRWLQQAKSM